MVIATNLSLLSRLVHETTPLTWLGLAFLALLVYAAVLAVYRLYFHPLRHIPGPRVAAVTQWYEFYYDVLKWPGGQYMHKVDEMHDKYGPVVRVSPHEVHLRNSEWINTLCTPGQERRDKFGPSAHMTGTPYGTFGTIEHDIHRARRSAVKGFFAQKIVDSLAPFIHEKVSELCDIMRKQNKRDGFVPLRPNLLAFSTDLLCALAFDADFLRLLDDEEKALQWHITINCLAGLTPLVKQFPWIIPIALEIPPTVLGVVSEPLARVVRLNRLMRKAAKAEIERFHNNDESQGDESNTKMSSIDAETPVNVFKTILQSHILSNEEKSQKRLTQEGFVFISAGGETCARSIAVAVFQLVSGPRHILLRLKEELQTVYQDRDSTPTVAELSKLPYLTAIIKECLRIMGLISSRLPLIAPDKELRFGDYVIPPGNPVSISLRDIQKDPEIFKTPTEFRPERWLSDDPDFELASKFHVAFGRGTRGCVGTNLAYAQLYIVISRLFMEFSMELYDTELERDVLPVRDCFLGEASIESRGIRVTLSE